MPPTEETDPLLDHRCMSLATALDIATKMQWDERRDQPLFDCKPHEHYQAFKKLEALVRDFIKDDRDPEVVEAAHAYHRQVWGR